MKKKYNDWVLEYPDRVVIRKEGFFYTCRDESADIVATILNYQIGVNEKDGGHITGSPSLVKIGDELKSHHISYVAIEHNEVVDEEVFSDNRFWDFINDEQWKEKIARLKNKRNTVCVNDDLLMTIDALMDGINPFTGEIMQEDDILKSDEMIAIYEAARRDLSLNQVKAKLDKDDLNANEKRDFERLRVLRRKIATEELVPCHVVFTDRTLIEMIKRKPHNEKEMLAISGIGKKKFDKYGNIFLEELQQM